MRAVAEGRLPIESPAFERHIDRCLGCRACEPVCPAGVEYGQLLEGARADLLKKSNRSGFTHGLLRFVLKHVWLSSARLRFVFRLGRLTRDSGFAKLLLKSKLPKLLSRQVEFGLTLLESSKGRPSPASGEFQNSKDGSRVLLFTGCVTEGLFSRVNQATDRVLQVNGCVTNAPKHQSCCGALHAHAGDLDGARILAQHNIEAFTDSEGAPIITNAGGCGAMLVSYSHLFADDPNWSERATNFSKRVRDVSQQLQVTGVRKGGDIGTTPVTYDASCHLINGQHAGAAPLEMLNAIPNLNFVPLTGSDRCCGGAGVYNLMEPELSSRVLNEKLCCINETGATTLATGNPGCHMQIRAGAMLNNMSVEVCHPVELLDESYRHGGMYPEREVANK